MWYNELPGRGVPRAPVAVDFAAASASPWKDLVVVRTKVSCSKEVSCSFCLKVVMNSLAPLLSGRLPRRFIFKSV